VAVTDHSLLYSSSTQKRPHRTPTARLALATNERQKLVIMAIYDVYHDNTPIRTPEFSEIFQQPYHSKIVK